MIREVLQLGDPLLRERSEPVTESELADPQFQTLVGDLMETMEAASGVGIAAPQVGVLKRVFIVASKPNSRYPNAPLMKATVMVNPVLEWASDSVEKDWEGCLSIPGIRGLVPRPDQIRVRFLDFAKGEEVSAEYRGFVARVWQHEHDHLNGIVFLDSTSSREVVTDSEYHKLLKRRLEQPTK